MKLLASSRVARRLAITGDSHRVGQHLAQVVLVEGLLDHKVHAARAGSSSVNWRPQPVIRMVGTRGRAA